MTEISGIIESKVLGKSGEGPHGPYQVYVFMVDGKRYSTFKKDIYDKFAVGQSVKITGTENDKGYFNMSDMIAADNVEVYKPGEEIYKQKYVEKVGKANGNGSMYAAYAKDIFCAIVGDTGTKWTEDTWKDCMNIAINLVKQAKEAFE